MKAWLAENALRLVLGLVAVMCIISLITLNRCSAARTAGTEAKLATGQAGAAIQSGADAVDTIGNTQANEAAADITTKENDDEIRNAPGASAPVDPAVRDAGLRSLCRRASYRSNPQCVQYAHP